MIDRKHASRWMNWNWSCKAKQVPTIPLRQRPRLHGRYRAHSTRIKRQTQTRPPVQDWRISQVQVCSTTQFVGLWLVAIIIGTPTSPDNKGSCRGSTLTIITHLRSSYALMYHVPGKEVSLSVSVKIQEITGYTVRTHRAVARRAHLSALGCVARRAALTLVVSYSVVRRSCAAAHTRAQQHTLCSYSISPHARCNLCIAIGLIHSSFGSTDQHRPGVYDIFKAVDEQAIGHKIGREAWGRRGPSLGVGLSGKAERGWRLRYTPYPCSISTLHGFV